MAKNIKVKSSKELTYYDAKSESLNVKWKTTTCGQGDKCWCRLIVPVKPIKYGNDEVFDCIVHMGAIDKELAEYIVELHNTKIELKNK